MHSVLFRPERSLLYPALVKQVTDKCGPIDILVNNAGINLKKEFTEVTDEDF